MTLTAGYARLDYETNLYIMKEFHEQQSRNSQKITDLTTKTIFLECPKTLFQNHYQPNRRNSFSRLYKRGHTSLTQTATVSKAQKADNNDDNDGGGGDDEDTFKRVHGNLDPVILTFLKMLYKIHRLQTIASDKMENEE